MDSRADNITRLETELEEVKGKRDELKPTDPYYAQQKLAYTEEITAKEKRWLFLMEQKGKFATHFLCPFPFLSITYFCPLSFDISSSPIQWRQTRKVRGDGLCRDVNYRCTDGG